MLIPLYPYSLHLHRGHSKRLNLFLNELYGQSNWVEHYPLSAKNDLLSKRRNIDYIVSDLSIRSLSNYSCVISHPINLNVLNCLHQPASHTNSSKDRTLDAVSQIYNHLHTYGSHFVTVFKDSIKEIQNKILYRPFQMPRMTQKSVRHIPKTYLLTEHLETHINKEDSHRELSLMIVIAIYLIPLFLSFSFPLLNLGPSGSYSLIP